MRSKRLVFIAVLIMFLIFIFIKIPNDNKESLKFNELEERINEIEKLVKSSKKSFEIIKQAFLDIKINKVNNNNLNNLKSLLKILQSKSEMNQSKDKLEWSNRPFKLCDTMNTTKSDIDLLDMYDKWDFEDVDGGVWKQGFELNYDTKFMQKLKVFVVPHSHQDPGWIKTVDEYFNSQTKPILDSMLQFLIKEPEMKFIYAEIVYFQMWWDTLSNNDQENVRRLVNNRQLEIVTGGWVMTDEANSHYFSIVNQLTEGHMWLKENLNYYPKSSWSIDPFGYSNSMPYFLQKSGIDNLLIQRVHYIIKKKLASTKQLEFLWKQSWDSQQLYAMPCQVMPFYSYDVPHTCGPDPSVCCQYDFLRKYEFGCPWGPLPIEITDENVNERSMTLMNQYRKKSVLFDNGNILLVPLGDDFRYKNEKEWRIQFDNYRKLMHYMNNKKEWNIEVKFATLSEYFESFDKDKMKNLPTLTGDMFSYADRLDHYWTGYFTTRPLLKSLDRTLMTNLRNAEIVLSLSLIYQQKYNFKTSTVFNSTELNAKILNARRTLSLFQHHDAIAGTSKNHVMEDYGKKLIDAIYISQEVFLKSAQEILEKNIEGLKLEQIMFDLDEVISSYGQEKKINFINLLHYTERYVYLFNSLSQPRQVVVHIPIETNVDSVIRVMGSGNQLMKCQLSPYILNNGDYANGFHFVSFKLNIGPLAFEQVQIILSKDIFSDNNCIPVEIHHYNDKNTTNSKIGYKIIKETSDENNFLVIRNSVNVLYISHLTGTIEKVKGYYSDKVHDFKVKFKKYGVRNTKETSGAYIFLPDANGKILESTRLPFFVHLKGNVFEEVHIKYEYVIHRIKVYQVDGALANAIDIENIIDLRDASNLELSMIVVTDRVIPSDVFYTDSNCFQFVKRKTLSKLPLQANVYPMSCGSFVQSRTGRNTFRMSVFSKQASGVMGGTTLLQSKSYSFLEMFQDRKLNQDDNRGLFEPVTDNKVTSVKHRIILEGWESTNEGNDFPYNEELSISSYQLLNDLTYPVQQLHVKSNLNSDVSKSLVAQKSLLTGLGLPCSYHMVNLRTNENGLPKLTLHRMRLNCDAKYISEGSCNVSRRKSVLLKSMFDDLTIKFVNKVSLSGISTHEKDMLPEEALVNVMEMETFELKFESR